jgi:cytochrome c oxidase assembly factor CtaG
MSHPGWTSWSLDPAFLGALALAAWAYATAYRRARRLAPNPPGAGHWLPYAGGLAALLVALASPLDAIGDDYLISAHMLQHVLLGDLAPALIVLGLRAPVLPLGLPRGGLRWIAPGGKLGRFIHVATRPWVALPVWAIATWVWAVPAVFDTAAAHPALHAFEHATLFYAGLAVWWLIVDPLPSDRLKPHPVRLAYLGFTRLVSAAVCLPLTWLATALYPRYADAPRVYGISPIRDQQLAGAAMCLLEFLIFGVAVAVVFIDMLGRDERMSERADALLSGPERRMA